MTAQFNRVNWLLSRNDALNVASNVTFAYDANGNVSSELTSARARGLHWDVRDTLTDVVDNGVTVGVYDYCYSKQRVKRTTASERVEYVLDDKFVLQEADGSQATHPSYRRYHYANAPLEVVDQIGSRFYTNDAEGSPSDLTNLNGTVQRAIQYDAWGKNRNNTAPTSAEPKLGYPITATAFQTGGQFAIGVLASVNQAIDDPSTVVTSAAALPGEAYRGFNSALDPKLNSDQRWTAFAQGLGATKLAGSRGTIILGKRGLWTLHRLNTIRLQAPFRTLCTPTSRVAWKFGEVDGDASR